MPVISCVWPEDLIHYCDIRFAPAVVLQAGLGFMANLSNSSIHRYYHFCTINLKRRSSEVLCPEGQYNCGRKNVFPKFLYFTSNYEVHHTYMNVIKEWTKQSRFETMPLPAPAYNCLHLSPVPQSHRV